MIRMQIQLPNNVYVRAKKLCESREISLAELARRGIEYILGVYAAQPGDPDEWQPPKPRRLGWKALTDAEIKAQAQATTAEISLARPRRK